jgi:hypothetical protein
MKATKQIVCKLAVFLTISSTLLQVARANPQITSVAFSGSPGNYTLTVNGSGFGTYPGSLPFTGDSSFFRIGDSAQVGHGEWGFSGDGNLLAYESWSDTQIQVNGFGGQPGDAIILAVWNPSSGSGATWGGNVPGLSGVPQISSVVFSGSGQTLQIIVHGSGFGSAPTTMPFTGDLNNFVLTDFGTHCGAGSAQFGAGYEGWGIVSASSVTLSYQSWSNDQIVIDGFSGSYGTGCATLQIGDPVGITLWSSADTSFTGLQTAWGGFVSTNLPTCPSIVGEWSGQMNVADAFRGYSTTPLSIQVTSQSTNGCLVRGFLTQDKVSNCFPSHSFGWKQGFRVPFTGTTLDGTTVLLNVGGDGSGRASAVLDMTQTPPVLTNFVYQPGNGDTLTGNLILQPSSP